MNRWMSYTTNTRVIRSLGPQNTIKKAEQLYFGANHKVDVCELVKTYV